jgi:hypothetical protein
VILIAFFRFLNFFLLIFILNIPSVRAQDLASIGTAKPLIITGALSATGIGYGAYGIPSRREPFTYFLNGNLNFSLYGWSIPLSVNYSNQNTVFQQPFNQYGLSPTYKWLTFHAGYRSMNFSSYTLGGHTFLGGGIEASPSIFRLAAMYGRLNKEVPYDSLNSIPVFERWGYGLKVGVGKDSDFLDLILFKAKDKLNKLPFDSVSEIYPAENLVLGINGAKAITKTISIGAEYATSAYTRDIRSDTVEMSSKNFYSHTAGLFTPKTSSAYYNAFKANIGYAGPGVGVQLIYERIDPEYITLGTYFFNNDMENITINTNVSLFKNKISLGCNIGTQRNNLNDDKTSTQKRFISSINANYSPNNQWNFSGTYSNFNSNSRRSARFDEVLQASDTLLLKFVQVSQNANLSTSYSAGQVNKYTISFNMSYQVANERQGYVVTDNRSDIFNGNLALNYKFDKKGPSVTASFNANRSIYEGQNALAFGPALSLNKTFVESIKANLSSSYNQVINNDESMGSTINTRISAGYTWMKKHNFNCNMVMMNKIAKANKDQSFSEYTGTVGYGFSF